ncbi:hypothetical protein TSTA_103010 [Talaromyces stipitatus ATCC 10500]|uniref:Retrotransposon gag domain-containing protein n=1 Tax=Talaromyces stipitatus (strain ATCC 10500 / CBS 375.48 / QM 6759 / NRRL 1006) TaxID=441959 RepID=B8MNI5_TALSN|nr:uncharacterized protein TSTA_103010 [Talaromyces stipitatus ATCC 10500]EED14074.1 hypothetical protein TSTA_103010 [Talaromyces stipitatus ATCC 10500]
MNLDSHIQAMVLPQLNEAESSTFWDYNTILDPLARVYDNPNKTHEAADRLCALKQGATETMPVFVAKFERVLFEARASNNNPSSSQQYPNKMDLSKAQAELAKTESDDEFLISL